MRVATLNLWGRFASWGKRLDLLVAAWGDRTVDVLFLQEVVRGRGIDQAADVAEALAYPFRACADVALDTGVSEGVAILSRHPLTERAPADLSVGARPRRAAVAAISPGGRSITLLSAHTVAVPDDARRRQIMATLRRPEQPLIIGADLNETPDAVARMATRHGLHDALAEDGSSPTWPICGRTFSAAWEAELGHAPAFSLAPKRIDYLLSRGITVCGSGVDPLDVGGEHPSDHALVWADYASPRSPVDAADTPSPAES